MIERFFQIGNIKVEFYLFNKPFYMSDDTIILGYPLGINPESFNENDVEDVKGYFSFIKISSDKIQIINDICGHSRLYYFKQNNNLLFSDDFLFLVDKIGPENRTKNKIEIEYWDTQRRTTGGETFVNEIHKIKPAHITNFYEMEIEEQLYFKDIINLENKNLHSKEVLADMRDTFAKLKTLPQKKILLYSGGTDSSLLVKLLQEQNIDFVPVFMKSNEDFMTVIDENKVLQASKKLNINVDIINVDKKEDEIKYFVKHSILDKGIHVLFYSFIKRIKEKYGEDIIIINGEGSDTLFNFLPTSKNFDHTICRIFMFYPCSFIGYLSYLLTYIYSFFLYLYRKIKNPKNCKKPIFFDLKYPMSLNEFLLAFSCRAGVTRALINTKKDKEFYKYLDKYIQIYKNQISNIQALLMYLELYFNWQGCESHTDIYSVSLNDLKIILPFCTPKIIYSTVKNTDYKYEILNPKSVTYRILKNSFNFKFEKLKKDKKCIKQINSAKTNGFEINRYKYFYDELKDIIFTKN